MQADPGFFGPASITWRVNREMTVLFGGARSLLLNAAHPLVAAGARQTGGYRKDPWMRLIQTLRTQSTVTFGTREEARRAADQVNLLHRAIHGMDPVTGRAYDALDPDLLLWVHAALEDSSVLFYEGTVAPLTAEDRQRYHEESMTWAELFLLPRARIPPTFEELRGYVHDVVESDQLRITEVAREVAKLVVGGAVPRSIKPLWAFISFAAVGTLPPKLRHMYGLGWGPVRQRALEAGLALTSRVRPLVPYRHRVIAPARWAESRMRSRPDLRFADQPRP